MNNSLLGLLFAAPFLTFVVSGTARADDVATSFSSPTFSSQAASAHGPYVRFELGGGLTNLSDAYWLPPGAADPQINFDLDGDDFALANVAFGYDWQNGYRADLGFLATSEIGFSGPCSSASDGSSCAIHADITDGTFQSTALMASVFFSPYEAQASSASFQPFVVAGLGVARNSVESWTRVNALSANPTRVFGANTETDLAWSLGVGASWRISQRSDRPVLLDLSLRHYDFGTAVGGATANVGSGVPREPLTFDVTSQVLSLGIRIPLQGR